MFKLGLYASIDNDGNLMLYGRLPRQAPEESKVQGLVSTGGEIIIRVDKNKLLFEHVENEMRATGQKIIALEAELKPSKMRKR